MLKEYKLAGYPMVFVECADENHVFEAAGQLADERGCGLLQASGDWVTIEKQLEAAVKQETILVVFDLQHFIRNPMIYRKLIKMLPSLKRSMSMMVAISPSWSLPAEMRHFAPVINFPMPNTNDLKRPLDFVMKMSDLQYPEDKKMQLLEAARGLAIEEAENAFSLSVTRTGEISPEIVYTEKARLIRQSVGLEMLQPVKSDSVGGLENFKEYLKDEVVPWARDEQLSVKGTLLVGPPGTGKTLSAKLAGDYLKYPVIRLDITSCLGSLVGQSESQFKQALSVVEAVAPAVLLLDEIDSMSSGHESSGRTDSGVMLRLVSILLYWMQERSAPVFVIATANYPHRIPAALMRPGRLDSIWAVDLPQKEERIEIAKIHLQQLKCSFDEDIPEYIAAATEEWSGAEIAAAVKSAARLGSRKITKPNLERAMARITPLSKGRADELKNMRDWANTYAYPASRYRVGLSSSGSRRIDRKS